MKKEKSNKDFAKTNALLKLSGIVIEESNTLRLSEQFLTHFFDSWKTQTCIHSAIYSSLLAKIDGEIDENSLASCYAIVRILMANNLRKHPEDRKAQLFLELLNTTDGEQNP